MTNKKKLIVLEGLDGVGKTSTANALQSALVADGITTALYREPGGTALGEGLRALVLDLEKMNTVTQFLLFQASRSALLDRLATETAEVVIFDRFWPSTLAYQVHGDGVSRKLFDACLDETLDQVYASGYKAHYVYLELDNPTRLARLESTRKAKDRFESRDAAFYTRVAEGYALFAEHGPDFFVNTGRPFEDVIDLLSTWVRGVK